MENILTEIASFKFSSNLQFVSSILKDKGIRHETDYEKNCLLADISNKEIIKEIINTLNIDENDISIEDDTLQGYREWNQNMYNPGYYTGGKVPFFTIDTNNYLMYGFVTLVSGLACLIEVLNSKNFSKTFFWMSVILICGISGSMFYQYYKFKRKQNRK
ncbi:hypothetical protein [Chryseobacterium sp.]|uniref:hypothetical protein n=1 Tax=Chryseobacterium sp. TaxID=1871047 RepID=UPI0011CA80EB|nr:hypothetical protein [Chryseobacterium sp.]TXF79395.1 hypothetical protein FUA25_03140 [Chryseobacterium sp.]